MILVSVIYLYFVKYALYFNKICCIIKNGFLMYKVPCSLFDTIGKSKKINLIHLLLYANLNYCSTNLTLRGNCLNCHHSFTVYVRGAVA